MEPFSMEVAMAGLKAVRETFSWLLDNKVNKEVEKRVREVMEEVRNIQDVLYSTREELFRLQTEKEELKRELAERDDWERRLSQYELSKTEGNAVVYKFKTEPIHYACPKCIEKKEIQILQDQNSPYTGHFTWPGCSTNFNINRAITPPSKY